MSERADVAEILRRRSLVRGALNTFKRLRISLEARKCVRDSGFRAPAPDLRRMSAETLEADDAIIESVKCPRCRQFIQPPCVCCEQGHFMCTPCKAHIEACPTCGTTAFPNKANTVFDKILQEMYFPCSNAENGCEALLKNAEIRDHQSQCRFEKIPCRFQPEGCEIMFSRKERLLHEEHCPFGLPCKIFLKAEDTVKVACYWRGSKEHLYEHIKIIHEKNLWVPRVIQSNDTFTWMLVLNMNMEKTDFIHLDDVGESFYFHVKNVCEGDQMLAVQHIGDDMVAASFMYAVEFKYGNKLIVFRDKVIPSSEKDVFHHSNCCNFHFKFLKGHFQAERVCDCYVRIFRCGRENAKGRRHLYFMGSAVSEEQDGSVSLSNRDSFRGVIENCLEKSPNFNF